MLSTQFCPTCGVANEAAQTQCFACGHSLSASEDAPATSDTPLLHERYQLGTMLGSGGFSTVYRAHDVQAGREVAIKQISLHGLSAEEAIEATDTFNREATAATRLYGRSDYEASSDQAATPSSTGDPCAAAIDATKPVFLFDKTATGPGASPSFCTRIPGTCFS